MAKKLSGFGAAFAEARADGKKTFEYPPGSGEKFTTQTKEEKDREVTPEAKKVMDQTRRDRESNFRAQARKADVAMETPEERGAMNLEGFKRDKKDMEGFKRDKKDMEGSGEYSPFKKGGSVKSSASKRADGIAQRGKTKGRMV
jgi:hypothetical protein